MAIFRSFVSEGPSLSGRLGCRLSIIKTLEIGRLRVFLKLVVQLHFFGSHPIRSHHPSSIPSDSTHAVCPSPLNPLRPRPLPIQSDALISCPASLSVTVRATHKYLTRNNFREEEFIWAHSSGDSTLCGREGTAARE